MSLPGPLRLLRPKQWTKNLLVLAAPLFTQQLLQLPVLALTLSAFFSLCLASSSVYCVNDLLDAEKDRHHPKKKLRPIASGEVSPNAAIALAILCAGVGLGIAFVIKPLFGWGVLLYLTVQAGYNFGLKKVPVLDVFVLGSGFVMRAALGAVAISVTISGWLLFCTGALALCLGFAKRRSELMSEEHDPLQSRPTLKSYTQPILDAMVVFSASMAALSYGVYAIQSQNAQEHKGLILTAPFVIYGIARYLFLTFTENEGGEPESLLFSDPHILVTIVLFGIAALLAISGIPLDFLSA